MEEEMEVQQLQQSFAEAFGPLTRIHHYHQPPGFVSNSTTIHLTSTMLHRNRATAEMEDEEMEDEEIEMHLPQHSFAEAFGPLTRIHHYHQPLGFVSNSTTIHLLPSITHPIRQGADIEDEMEMLRFQQALADGDAAARRLNEASGSYFNGVQAARCDCHGMRSHWQSPSEAADGSIRGQLDSTDSTDSTLHRMLVYDANSEAQRSISNSSSILRASRRPGSGLSGTSPLASRSRDSLTLWTNSITLRMKSASQFSLPSEPPLQDTGT